MIRIIVALTLGFFYELMGPWGLAVMIGMCVLGVACNGPCPKTTIACLSLAVALCFVFPQIVLEVAYVLEDFFEDAADDLEEMFNVTDLSLALQTR